MTTHTYTFEQLSENAKNVAREWWQSGDYQNMDAEFVFEDAATIADMFGLDIRQTRKTRMDNSHFSAPTIYYSGFCSQGDGACFEGKYRYKKGGLKAVKEYAPLDAELHKIVQALQDVQKQHFYKLEAETKHSGHYYHSGCMRVEVGHIDDNCRDIGNAEDDVKELLREFADWIYSRLESEYKYQNSTEVIDENIINNECLFNEDGSNWRRSWRHL